MISADYHPRRHSRRSDRGHFPELPDYYRGKVRDNYDLADGRRILISTDRQSAFDQILAAVPFKGRLLTQIARFWFEATADIAANHVLDYPDPNVVVGRRLAMLPVEMVVRDYLTGSTETSIWPMYRDGRRAMYGLHLPDGLRKNDRLPGTVITPTTKAAAGSHDAPVSPAEIVERGLLIAGAMGRGRRAFRSGSSRAAGPWPAERGLILVDTKFEFGLDPAGRITLADEILTPDSSRYWKSASYGERHGRGRGAGKSRQGVPAPVDRGALRSLSRADPADTGGQP